MVRNAPAIVAKQIPSASPTCVEFETYKWNETCPLIHRQSRARLAGAVSKPKEL
jgi:hypothetical protein